VARRYEQVLAIGDAATRRKAADSGQVVGSAGTAASGVGDPGSLAPLLAVPVQDQVRKPDGDAFIEPVRPGSPAVLGRDADGVVEEGCISSAGAAWLRDRLAGPTLPVPVQRLGEVSRRGALRHRTHRPAVLGVLAADRVELVHCVPARPSRVRDRDAMPLLAVPVQHLVRIGAAVAHFPDSPAIRCGRAVDAVQLGGGLRDGGRRRPCAHDLRSARRHRTRGRWDAGRRQHPTADHSKR
jgi:hypothetical protein